VRVEGQLVFNSASLLLAGALKGLGLAYLTEGHVQPYVSQGHLVRVLSDWRPPSPATTSIIPAGASHRRRSRCWSRRFGTATDGQSLNVAPVFCDLQSGAVKSAFDHLTSRSMIPVVTSRTSRQPCCRDGYEN
jgi:hypothetical protein